MRKGVGRGVGVMCVCGLLAATRDRERRARQEVACDSAQPNDQGEERGAVGVIWY